MANKINIRSPYLIQAFATVSDGYAIMKLWVYTGVKQTTPSSSVLRYTIRKQLFIEDGSNLGTIFEISELVRDYLDVAYDGDYNSQTVWVDYEIEVYDDSDVLQETITPSGGALIGYDGYGYFEDGVNPQLSQPYLQSNKTIYRLNDHNVRIPIDTDKAVSATFRLNGETVRTETFTTSTNTDAQIKYFSVGDSYDDTYKQRVLSDGGEFEDNSLLREFLSAEDVGNVDEVWVSDDNETEVIRIVTEPCTKFTPYKVVFVNKFGALQDLYFSRKSISSINAKGDTYKSNLVGTGAFPSDYSTSKHQYSQLNKTAKESITLNTGFLSEEYNDVFTQLMMSEKVWMIASDSDNVMPVTPKTNSLTYKTSVNDRLVQYTVQFDMAFDKINTVR